MAFDPKQHHRRSIRVSSHCYSDPGWYFVTICVKDRREVFGEIVDGRMILHRTGYLARRWIKEIKWHFKHIRIDSFQFMPDHVHFIIQMKHVGAGFPRPGEADDIVFQDKRKDHSAMVFKTDDENADGVAGKGGGTPPLRQYPILGRVIGYYKYMVAKTINGDSPDKNFFWQQNYYERIIRSYDELENVRMYIRDNPLNDHVD